MPKAVILPMFFCVMRLYIVTKIRKVKKISTNNMFFFIYICISFAIMFIRRKIRELELSLPGQETSSENDLMMMGGGWGSTKSGDHS